MFQLMGFEAIIENKRFFIRPDLKPEIVIDQDGMCTQVGTLSTMPASLHLTQKLWVSGVGPRKSVECFVRVARNVVGTSSTRPEKA